MSKIIMFLLLLTVFFGFEPRSYARTEVKESAEAIDPQEAEKEASKYFRKKKVDSSDDSKGNRTEYEHYMAVHLGAFASSDSYSIGDTPHSEGTGRVTAGFTYRMASLGTLFDWAVRVDFMGNQVSEGRSVMMGVYPMILFPEAGSMFPLYFGIAFGPGIFFQQLKGESPVAFAYQLVGGVRLFNLMGESTGLFIEAGLKNSILLLSDGQFNGLFVSVGPVFSF